MLFTGLIFSNEALQPIQPDFDIINNNHCWNCLGLQKIKRT